MSYSRTRRLRRALRLSPIRRDPSPFLDHPADRATAFSSPADDELWTLLARAARAADWSEGPIRWQAFARVPARREHCRMPQTYSGTLTPWQPVLSLHRRQAYEQFVADRTR